MILNSKSFKAILILLTTMVCLNLTFAQSFLKTQGQDIVNEEGEPIILRGMGLGGWMLQEGYMLQTAGFASAQFQIKQKIEELIGEESTQEFYDAWLANHVTKDDIDALKEWGFNSVRLPMHYNLFTLPLEEEPIEGQNTWLEKGFELTDQLIEWCAENEMYVILDLHAAPGGQGFDQGISDYDTSKPSFWESAGNQAKAVALWERIAQRYKDEPWIGGYDLLNEPNWNLPGGTALRNFYEQTTERIRAVDQRHIIFIEGNWFANDFTGLTPPWDDNMAYSPHKYWSFNDQSSIQWVLDLRNTYDVPLYLGESGENSNTWFRDAIKLLEDNNIGWAWWPMKKIEAIAGPLSVIKTPEYDQLLDFWNNGGSTPNAFFAKAALMEITENLKFENCIYQKDVIDAMFRQIDSDQSIPFNTQEIPGKVLATDFDMGRNGVAYFDTDLATYQVSSGIFTAWNTGWAYRNDGVDIETSNDTQGNGFNVGWIEDGEWMQYDVNVNQTAAYDIKIRVATAVGGGNFYFTMDDTDLTTPFYVGGTGDWQSWNDIVLEDVILDTSMEKLKFVSPEGGFNLSSFEFIEKGSTQSVETEYLSAFTIDQNTIQLNLNKRMDESSNLSVQDFRILVNGPEFTIDALSFQTNNPRSIVFNLSQALNPNDIIKISYSGEDLNAEDGSKLSTFNLKNVENLLPIIHEVPGRIESEEYFFESGIDTENTFDTGGGKNIGNTNTGDFLDYYINVAESGTFSIDYRTAGESEEGQIKLYLYKSEEDRTLLQTVNFEPTGDVQTWETTSSTPVFELARGMHQLRIEIAKGNFKMNWMEFEQLTVPTENIQTNNAFNIYPNPSKAVFFVNTILTESQNASINVFNILGQNLLQRKYTNITSLDDRFDLSDFSSGTYFVHLQLENGNTQIKKIVKQ